jgi:hypothetical protein
MKNFFVFNEGFSKSKTSSYILSLQIDETGYSYSIVDTAGKAYAAINHHTFDKKFAENSVVEKAEMMIREDLFLSKNYKAVYFSYITQKSTLVPAELFDKQNIREYFMFNHNLDESEEIHFNYVKKIDAYIIFAIPSELTNVLINKFPEIVFIHQNNLFINNCINRAERMRYKVPYITINVNSGSFDIAIYKDDKFVMCNTYLYTNDNDFVYYLMNTLNQYEIRTNKSYIVFTGFVERDTEFFYLLHQFLPKINFLKLESGFSYNFKDVDEHLLYNLLNLHNEDY